MIIPALAVFVELTLWYYLVNRYLSLKYSKIFQLIIAISSYFILLIVDIYNNSSINIASFILYICLFSLILTTANFWKKATIVIIFVMINILSEVFVALLLSQIFNVDSKTLMENEAINQLGRLSSKTIMIILTYIVLQINLGNEIDKKQSVGSIGYLLLVFPVSAFLLLIGIVDIQIINDVSGHLIIAGIIGMIFSALLVYYLLERTLKLERTKNELLVVNEKERIDHNYYKLLEMKYENIRFLKHDFNSHMSIIYQFASNQRTDELLQYLSEFKLTASETIMWKSKIRSLDVVLNVRNNIINDNQIKVDLDTEEIEEERISLVDQSVIFSNLLDNAIKGTLSMPVSERFINIRVRLSKPANKIVFKISNTSLISNITRRNENQINTIEFGEHGYGIKIINRICIKNNANFQIRYNKEHSIVEAIIVFN